MSTVYSIAGHDIQNFGKDPRESRASFKESTDNLNNTQTQQQRGSLYKSNLKKTTKYSQLDTELVKSYYEEDPQDEKKVNKGDEEDLFYEPQDLGVEYFEFLQQKYKERNQFSTKDPNTLFDFWKSLRKMKKNQKQQSFAPKVTDDMTDSQMKRIAEILEKRQKEQIKEQEILRANPQDVQHTLTIHSQEEQKDQTMSRFFKNRAKEIELENRRKKELESKQDKKKREESQQRLYSQKQKPPEYEEDRKKREKEEKKRQKELEKNQEYQKQMQFENKRKQRNEFINNLRAAHKKENPDVKDYVTQQKLEDFYGTLENEKRIEHNLPENAKEIKNDLDLYFEERAQDLLKVHNMKQGYDTKVIDDIVKVWKNKTTALEKQKFYLDFEDEGNVRECLENYFNNKEKQRKQEEEQMQKEREEEEKKEQEKIEKAQQQMEKQCTKLATAKDRLKLGKQILILKQMFPNDKVLRKLLLKEFQDTRLAKFPEEYDVYDSDEENAIKERIKPDKKITLESMEKPSKEKEEVIKKLFEKMLTKYEKKKKNQIENEQEKKMQQMQNDIKMERFMHKKAKEFIDQRNKRFDEFDDDENEGLDDEKKEENKVQTLKQFLSKTYKEMVNGEHKEATKRNFPHLKYGESAKLKKRSFPVTFKRHFFRIVKQYLRSQDGSKKDKGEKLPFWVPGGDGMRCRIHEKIDCPKNCKYVTQNKKVIDLMATFKSQKNWEKQIFKYDKQIAAKKKEAQTEAVKKEIEWLEEQRETLYLKKAREQNNAWVDDKYLNERSQVMLTYSDAQNCTFQPDVRIPRKDENGQRTFEKWVEAWGENFKKKQPRIFKLGVLKQCSQLISKGKYLDAYSKLRDTFNIEEIKEHFDTEAGRPYKMISTRSMYIQGKEDPEEVKKKMPHENFENPNNIPILLDVDKMVRFLENYEQNLKRAKEETQKMIEQDPFAPEDPLHTKSLMATSQFKDGEKSTMSTMTSTTYAQRRKQVKTFMCPLGDKCPRIMEGRWPQSDISSIVPLGAQCEFAHTYAELKFRKELKSKKNMLKNYVKLLEGKKDPQVKSWNPAGNKFEQCNGCGFRCRMCKERQTNMERIQKYQEVKEKNLEFLKKYEEDLKKKEKEEEEKKKKELEEGGGKKGLGALKKFAKQMATKLEKDNEKKYKFLKKQEEKSVQKIKEKKEQEEKYNKKISQLQKANTLYKQERYSEAFKVICNSVQIVKQELEEEQEKEKEEDAKWRHLLGLNEDQEITAETVYQNLNKVNDDPELEDQAHILYLYAQKRGIIGHKKPNVNQFLNIQIEESYLKIEKKLTDKEKDIALMKQKIEKIEGEEDENDENKQTKRKSMGTFDWRQYRREQNQGTQICEYVKQGKKCPQYEEELKELTWQHKNYDGYINKEIPHRCQKSHQPYEIYLEKGEQKINNLNRSIKLTENEIVKSTKPQPYKPSSAQTAIMDVNTWRDKQMERELAKPSNKQKKNKIDKSHRAEIWEKDVDELLMPVHERPKKQV